MPKIFYSLAGEGLGHASRTLSIIEHLPEDYEVFLFTWGEAYDFFQQRQYPRLHKTAALPFGRRNGRIDKLKTTRNFAKFMRELPSSLDYVTALAELEQPDLLITDFEAVIPRVAKRLGRSYISIDNQHKFSRCDMSGVSFGVRFHCYWMGWYTERLVPNPELAVVSTFHHTATKNIEKKTVLTNCFMRSIFDEVEVGNDGFHLLYWKGSSGNQISEALANIDAKVIVYGCPKEQQKFPFVYKSIANDEFVRDLSRCRSLFCSSGNQLLGEGIYLGKPIYTVPEPNQPEQWLNAHLVQKLGYGKACDANRVTTKSIMDFLNEHKCRDGVGVNGVHDGVRCIRDIVEGSKKG